MSLIFSVFLQKLYSRSLSEIEANFKNINKNILWIGRTAEIIEIRNDLRVLLLQGRLFTITRKPRTYLSMLLIKS